MKKSKLTKLIAVVLVIAMLSASFGAVTAGASSIYPVISNGGDLVSVLMTDVIDTLLRILTDFLASLFGDGPTFYPEGNETLEERTAANFYEGTGKDFQDEAKAGAQWHLGYANTSLIPEDYDNGTYYIGGYIAPENGFTNVVEGIAEIPGIGKDDMKVRCIAISDGSETYTDNSGNKKCKNTVLFAVIDSIGVTNADIKDIRQLVADYAERHPDVINIDDIAAINISATHCHSGIDTEGLWTRNIAKLVSNGVISGTKAEGDLEQGTNPAYMKWMKEKVANALIKSYKDMEAGKLTYTTKDIGQDYYQNKNRPTAGELVEFDDEGNLVTNGKTEVAMTNIERFIFTPDDEASTPTMILNIAAHPDVAGLPTESNSGREISGDYIFYCGKYLEDAGYNFIFFQGAIAGIYMARSATGDGVETKQRVEESQRFGFELARIALSLNDTEEQIVANTFTNKHVFNDSAKEISENAKQIPMFDKNNKAVEQAISTDKYAIIIPAQGKNVAIDGTNIKVSDGDKLLWELDYPDDVSIEFNEMFGGYTVTSGDTPRAIIITSTDVVITPIDNHTLSVNDGTVSAQFQLPNTLIAPEGTYDVLESTVQINPHYSIWYENWEKVDSVEVEPFLNLYLKQVEVPITNTLITAVGKLNMANYLIKVGENGTYSAVTEIGYMELGNQFKTVFLPGEICQDLVAPNGKSLIASNAATARPFAQYVSYGATTAAEIFGNDVRCFGVMNDAIGYVVPDNDYTMGDPANHYHELISLGQHVGSALIDGLYELAQEIQ